MSITTKVAIIDDVQMNLTLMQHQVRKLESCEPVCFTDPIAGLAWCLENDPDLIVLDYMMPQLSGTEITQKIREKFPETPILMVTANHETELRHQALQIGVTDFLNKPMDYVEFLARAKNLLALQQSRRKLADHASWLADEVHKATNNIVARERETIFCLSKAAEYRDPETGSHILRMAHYSRLIALNLGMSSEQAELLFEAAPMHDVGKVGIPDLILLKPGKLSDSEFIIMQQHPAIGYEILNSSKSEKLQMAAKIALCHHEKFDGSGYPGKLQADAIPLFARIVAVADVFDALTSERPYKKAWSIEQASQFLREQSGSHFDPDCVKAFFNAIEEVLKVKSRFQDDNIEIRDRTLE